MYTTRAPSLKALQSPQTAKIGRAIVRNLGGNSGPASLLLRPSHESRRQFSSTPRSFLEIFPPPKDANAIKITPPAWHHPQYSEGELKLIDVAHKTPTCWQDKVALGFVNLLRWGTDKATGYHHEMDIKRAEEVGKKGYAMNERKWMIRFIFLETVAGVPGMVGGMLRHLRSIRRLKRDNGWIETLLEEAYNERMHLLTFMKLAEPGWFMKFMILGAQGVFFNGFFLSYLVSPKICHRFVGYLEEQAVMTYTHAIHDIEEGRLPAWEHLQAPDIAIRYWNMPEGYQTMRDLLYYVRADEAKHREVNHTLGNLDQIDDPNPYVSEYKDETKPHPTKTIDPTRPVGWERKDIMN